MAIGQRCQEATCRAEADHRSADRIAGVQLRMQMYAWGQNCQGWNS